MSTLPTTYQEFIALSRYSRFRPDLGRRETWEETVDRLFAFWKKQLPQLDGSVLAELRDYVLNLKVMPSMRSLMTAGPALERSHVAGYNCSAASISGKGEVVHLWDDKLKEMGFEEPIKVKIHNPIVFDEMFYILLCFHPDTLVETRSGAKRISEILVGEEVFSYDESAKQFKWSVVTDKIITPSAKRKKVRVTLDSGQYFDCTADHKWLTHNRGWVEAQDLAQEDDLVAPTFSIYKHEHPASGAAYVGYTAKPVEKRWAKHQWGANSLSSKTYDTKFAQALRSFPAEEWEHTVLDSTNSLSIAHELEKLYIAQEEPSCNMTGGGQGTLGRVATPEQRKQMSENAYVRTPEHRAAQAARLESYRDKINEAHKTPEYIELMRRINTGPGNPQFGKKLSEERKKELSEMNKGEKNHFFGRTHTEETRALLSAAAKERVAINGPNFKGCRHSEESLEKMRKPKKKRLSNTTTTVNIIINSGVSDEN